MFNLDAIKAKMEAQTCPEHHQHPQVNIVDDSVSIAACCQPFHATMSQMLEHEIEASMSSIMEEAMKHLEGNGPQA